MAKRKAKNKPRFRLSATARTMLNKYLTAISRGVENVCELHTHDSNPSIRQAEFEKLYIDKLLAQPIAAISATLRTMTQALTEQKEVELQALNKNIKTPKDGKGEQQ